MYYIDKEDSIYVSRGDSCAVATSFYFDENFNDKQDENEAEGVLSENAVIIFTVKAIENGYTKIKKILTSNDYLNGGYVVEITPQETMLEPAEYEYSFLYIPDKNALNEAHTYKQGKFIIMNSVSVYTDL
ncbi:MAG: hypothetical protein NC320_09115 [Clostridium sp.]|nr:hypothetical protein [Clostridium sp.]MCM1547913.1 hypothetical protein [Ruminococcus sp.]